MKKTKSFGLLIVGAVLLIAGVIFAVLTYNNSYQESVAVGKTLKEVKAQISEAEEGNTDVDLDALKAQQSELSAEKLRL